MGFKTRSVVMIAALVLSACTGQRLPAPCQEKPSSGRCEDSLTRFYYDAGWDECRAFIWGGCEGNAPFDSMRDCTSTCNASPGDLWQRQQNTTSGNPAGQ